MDIQPGQQMLVVDQRLAPALVRQRQRERQRGIAQRLGGGARHGPRHVGDAVMHHAFLDIGRVGMAGRPAGLQAAALVDGDIHHHRALPHLLHHRPRHQLRRRGTRHQHRADHQVGLDHRRLDRRRGRIQRLNLAAEHDIQLLQPRQRAVEDRHMRPQPHRHHRRMRARNAAADDHHAPRRHPWHAAQQHARAALFLLQALGADMHAHPPRHLAHRRQQRQGAARVGHGLIGDAGRAALDQPLGLRLVGGEVQIGEQHLALAQHGDLGGQRLLHLHDHVGIGEHLGRIGGDARPGGAIGVVAEADGARRPLLHAHRMAAHGELAHRIRGQPDAVLVGLDFLGNADAHDRSFSAMQQVAERAVADSLTAAKRQSTHSS